MRVGTYGSAGPDGASARPSRGDCSLVCNRIATSRSSSSIGGKAIGAVDDDDIVRWNKLNRFTSYGA